MSYTFKKGQQVVCVSAKSGTPNRITRLEQDRQYTVLDTEYCRKCGRQSIDVGVRTIHSQNIMCLCGLTEDRDNRCFHDSSRFVPLQEWQQSEAAVDELLQPVKVNI